MTLRNAFANLVTESFSGVIENLLTRMDERENRKSLMEIPRALQYARTANDEMRVVMTSGVVSGSSTYFGSANVVPTYHSTGAPTSMDARVVQAEASMQTFNQVRTNRWKVT